MTKTFKTAIVLFEEKDQNTLDEIFEHIHKLDYVKHVRLISGTTEDSMYHLGYDDCKRRAIEKIRKMR